jgi:hypothetical protein
MRRFDQDAFRVRSEKISPHGAVSGTRPDIDSV